MFFFPKLHFHNVCDFKGTPCQAFCSLFKILFKCTENIYSTGLGIHGAGARFFNLTGTQLKCYKLMLTLRRGGGGGGT